MSGLKLASTGVQYSVLVRGYDENGKYIRAKLSEKHPVSKRKFTRLTSIKSSPCDMVDIYFDNGEPNA